MKSIPLAASKNALAFPDAQGRHVIPNGFVTLTSDSMGDVRYTPDDYRRMALMGANFQVIRIYFGKIGAWPGYKPDPKYFEQMDEMVELGRNAGMQSIFKLTVYDIKGIGEFSQNEWRDLYLDKDGRHKLLVDAWRRVFRRYKNDSSVFGYDLINEPVACGAKEHLWVNYPEFGGQDAIHRDFFVPLYRKIIDALQQVSPEKCALFQPYHVPPRIHIATKFPCLPLNVPLERSNIVFAPHYYGDHPKVAMRRYLKDATVSNAPVLFGEYGKPTFAETDSDPAVQAEYRRILIETVAEFDRRVIGGIKAWWCGSRVFNRALKENPKSRTWALFTDESPTGVVERKYIADVIARPRPLAIAGEIKSFGFDFDTRVFKMKFIPDPSKGESEIFVPVDRHYPEGFCVSFNGAKLVWNPSAPTALQSVGRAKAKLTGGFHWDAKRMRLVASAWRLNGEENILRIIPRTHE